jgi:hypothetical protein
MTEILKEKVISGGLNSVGLRIEREKNKVYLNVSFIESNPYKITEKRYLLSKPSTWKDSEFLFQLSRLIKQ